MLDCGCVSCHRVNQKNKDLLSTDKVNQFYEYFRYACEICGNKRCPHHSDHRLTCTSSNEPGQEGSIFT